MADLKKVLTDLFASKGEPNPSAIFNLFQSVAASGEKEIIALYGTAETVEDKNDPVGRPSNFAAQVKKAAIVRMTELVDAVKTKEPAAKLRKKFFTITGCDDFAEAE